jgi:dGTPase
MHWKIRDRKYYEQVEASFLAPYALHSAEAHFTRIHDEEQHPYRTAIQRDRDRIVHSRAFRRLKHKQQVFLISEGDHYRTRLTHTLEVAQLSRTIARALGLNEDLVEAIALGHDLGHTPFGHIGEVVLNEILTGRDSLNGLLSARPLGGFKHNYQSLRVVDAIEKKYAFDGLNLTGPVREGILKHTRLLRQQFAYPDFIYDHIHFELDAATTLEGQVTAIADEIAQRTHDLEDGIRAGLVEIEQVRKVRIVGLVEQKLGLQPGNVADRYDYRNRIIRGLINLLVDDILTTTLSNLADFYHRKQRLSFFDEEIVRFSPQLDPLQQELDEFIDEAIIFKCQTPQVTEKNKNVIRMLFIHFLENPARLPAYILKRGGWSPLALASPEQLPRLRANAALIRIIADHIASMTDRFALLELNQFEAQI